ncbi:hypothetical protein OJ998_03230 [Solirubrobacter taibaiensis]|nr:hypothetical protein [Solirubrobacter taibaiensis]
MPASRATAFDRLAPDQRAAVELVLRQGRSYGELSDLLGMPEETIRTRARSGLAALAPDRPAPARSGEIADWLLGQQSQAHAERTRALLLAEPEAHRWAAEVAAPLREVPGGDAVPALPGGPDQPHVNGKAATPAADDAAPRQTAAADAPTRGDDAAPRQTAAADAPTRGDDATGDDWFDDESSTDAPADTADRDTSTPTRESSSRLGGALLIGAALAIVAIVLAFVFTRGTDEPETSAGTPPTATATPSTTAVAANQVLLRGPAGSTAVGLMELFRANDDTVRFAIAAQGIAANAEGQRYSIWLTREDGAPRLLGDVRDAVGEDGQLTAAGPGNDDTDEFLDWLQTYQRVAITLDDEGAKEPGKVILSGDLPTAAVGGG